MAYRDDYDALLARLAALEDENRRLRAEIEELRRPPPPPPPAGAVTCSKCGRVEPAHYKFCLGCGAELRRSLAPPQRPAQSTICPQCRADNPPLFKFCKDCGTRIQ